MISTIKYIADTIKINAEKAGISDISADQVFNNGINIALYAAGIIAVLVIIIAGFYFMVAAYDPQKIAIAKNAILYAVIGLIVVLLAFVIVNFVVGRF